MADVKKEYVQSDAVKQAQAALQAQQAAKPGAYTSPWQQSLNDTVASIQNRKPFSYDLNADALYQQYKDRYIQQGQQAMMDTMGQAAALTGGYGNSYAQTVGQQTYQGYLQGLNDRVPELYQLALQRYQQEGDALMDQYGLLADRENTDYGRYRDQVGDYNSQLEYLYNLYNNERGFDYGAYRDNLADRQWQAEFDENNRRYNQEWAAANAAASASSGGGGNGGSGGSGYDPEVAALQQQLNAMGANLEVDGIRGPLTEAAEAKYLGGGSGFGGTTYSEAVAYLQNNGVSGASASSIMTQSEWQRRKNSGSTSPYVTNHNSYQEYLSSIVDYKLETN